MNPDEYTVVINGKPVGPYHLNELKNLNIQPETFIRKPEMADYKEAHEIIELRELFNFTHKKTAPQYFASFDLRLLASVIDHFIIFTIYAVFILVSFTFIDETSSRLMLIIVPMPFIIFIKLIYGSFVEAGFKQATIGKRLVGIKVSDLEGSKISLRTSFIRNFSKTISVLPLFFGYFYSFLNKEKQCWHDRISGSLVIKDRLI